MSNVVYLAKYKKKPQIDIAMIVESYCGNNGLLHIWQKKLQNAKNNNDKLNNLFLDFYNIIRNDVEHM
jgi:hypothetical protein